MSRESISPKLRFDVLKRDAFTCQYCGRSAPEVELHVDHVVPVAEGGGNDPGNLTAACVECNLGKSDEFLADAVRAVSQAKTEEEWIERMTIHVRTRFGGARPDAVRTALREVLSWGGSTARILFLTGDATSWVDWLRRIYMFVGALIERDMITGAIQDRWSGWDKTAAAHVTAATAQPSHELPEAASTSEEVN